MKIKELGTSSLSLSDDPDSNLVKLDFHKKVFNSTLQFALSSFDFRRTFFFTIIFGHGSSTNQIQLASGRSLAHNIKKSRSLQLIANQMTSIISILSTFDQTHFVLIWQISIFDGDFEDTEN